MPKLKLPNKKWANIEKVKTRYNKNKKIKMSKRLHAIYLLFKGLKRKEISEILGVSESSIKNWRKKWDKNGKEGLKSHNKGTKSKISSEIKVKIKEIIEVKKEIDGIPVTGKLIKGYIEKTYGITISYSHACYILRKMGYVRLRPRKTPANQDEKQREDFKKKPKFGIRMNLDFKETVNQDKYGQKKEVNQ